MSEKLKPVCCGCGGEAIILKVDEYLQFPDTYYVRCTKCTAGVGPYDTEVEAVKAWNRAMGERTAKVKDFGHPCGAYGYCSNCNGYCVNEEPYCPHCGAKLDWSEL